MRRDAGDRYTDLRPDAVGAQRRPRPVRATVPPVGGRDPARAGERTPRGVGLGPGRRASPAVLTPLRRLLPEPAGEVDDAELERLYDYPAALDASFLQLNFV